MLRKRAVYGSPALDLVKSKSHIQEVFFMVCTLHFFNILLMKVEL